MKVQLGQKGERTTAVLYPLLLKFWCLACNRGSTRGAPSHRAVHSPPLQSGTFSGRGVALHQSDHSVAGRQEQRHEATHAAY